MLRRYVGGTRWGNGSRQERDGGTRDCAHRGLGHASPYVDLMVDSSTVEPIKQRAVVAAITHDDVRIWLVHDDSGDPTVSIVRDDPKHAHRHVRPAQAMRGHASEVREGPYFDYVADVLTAASEVVLVGHGKGKGNAVERFMQHSGQRSSDVLHRIVGTGNLNLPHMTNAEIASTARQWWKDHRES